MVVALLAAGAALAGAGTPAAAVALVGACVIAALDPGPVSTSAVWAGATATGLLVLGAAPRRLAVPIAGVAAAIAAGAASNGALFLPLWLLATVAAALRVDHTEPGRRWVTGLVLADLPIVAGVAWACLRNGFAAWPAPIDDVSAWLLLAGALARAPLTAGSQDLAPAAGVLVVRAQLFVAAVVAISGQTAVGFVRSAAVAGALTFAVGALATRMSVRDGVQEAGLAVVALAASGLGWVSDAWFWAALAAGTLTHLVRIAAPRRTSAVGEVSLLVAGGAFGAPMLGVVAVLVGGAAGSAWFAAVVVVALVAGLGLRARGVAIVGRRRVPRATPAFAGLALAGAVWVPLISRPGGPGARAWPPWWTLIAVGVGAVAGVALAPSLAPARPRRPRTGAREPRLPVLPDPSIRLAYGLLGAWAVGAFGVWALGFLRGFL